jgi:hypothetical protein
MKTWRTKDEDLYPIFSDLLEEAQRRASAVEASGFSAEKT